MEEEIITTEEVVETPVAETQTGEIVPVTEAVIDTTTE